jgi:predicted nuclease of predicted toxin-antitoxin system
MLSFYMDHHVNIAIANGLRKRGIDVVTTFEDGMADVADEVLLSHVASLGRVLVTQD